MRRFPLAGSPSDRLIHQWIRFPARFHPPVARKLVCEFSREGEWVLDPFCGSGSILVEAASEGRNAVGLDADPFAAFISRAKARQPDVSALSRTADRLMARLEALERDPQVYLIRQFEDINAKSALAALRRDSLWAPAIPNLFHWFRAYVVVDLARILKAISEDTVPRDQRNYFLLAFAACLRRASNADPVPVSGVEVTRHMKELDEAGRIVNPFDLFRDRVRRNLEDLAAYQGIRSARAKIHVRHGDATRLTRHVDQPVGVAITSPPYHNAVDYHRRNMLESYWLGLVDSPEDRQLLRQQYLGVRGVMRHRYVTHGSIETPVARDWFEMMNTISPSRAAEFKHYVVGMRKVGRQLALTLRGTRSKVVLVVGNSTWNGAEIPTSELFQELFTPYLEFDASYYYPVRNHSMSYDRRNGAEINREYILVFSKARSTS